MTDVCNCLCCCCIPNACNRAQHVIGVYQTFVEWMNDSVIEEVVHFTCAAFTGGSKLFKDSYIRSELTWGSANAARIYKKTPELNMCRTVVYNLITWKHKLWDSFEKQTGSRWWNEVLELVTWLTDYGFISVIASASAKAVMSPSWDPRWVCRLPGVADWQIKWDNKQISDFPHPTDFYCNPEMGGFLNQCSIGCFCSNPPLFQMLSLKFKKPAKQI